MPQLRVPQINVGITGQKVAATFKVLSSRRVLLCVRVPCVCVCPQAQVEGGEDLPAAGTARRVVQQQPADACCHASRRVSARSCARAAFGSFQVYGRAAAAQVSGGVGAAQACASQVPSARSFSRGPNRGGLPPERSLRRSVVVAWRLPWNSQPSTWGSTMRCGECWASASEVGRVQCLR